MATGTQHPLPVLELLDESKPHVFISPVKRINEGQDVSLFLTSEAYRDIMTFLMQLNRAMFPRLNHDASSGQENLLTWEVDAPNIVFSESVVRLRNMLQALDKIIDDVPPDAGPRRFGNVSFRKWSELLESRAPRLLEQFLPKRVVSFPHESKCDAISELKAYFIGAFGSSQRLDYGTGHELSFLAFLACIWKLGGFQPSTSGVEERGIVIGVFVPAQYAPPITQDGQIPVEGSRKGAPDPGSVAKSNLVAKEREKNMYMGAIGFIYDVKTGPFWEHSPTLYDISGVRAGWAKINKGMIKMYNAEVLSKFPVVQHFPFGSLFSWNQDSNASPPPVSTHTSSQPTKIDAESRPTSRVPAQSTAQVGTKAPWMAAKGHVPGAVVGTQAPWAKRSPSLSTATQPELLPPSDAEIGVKRSTRLAQETRGMVTQQILDNSREGQLDTSSMPPPTTAPWAR
ncbi:MAG: hypothetical protein Q9187_003630 [Circinaria calcarea]